MDSSGRDHSELAGRGNEAVGGLNFTSTLRYDAAYVGTNRFRPQRDMLEEMGLRQPGPTPMLVDNTAVLSQVDELTAKKKGKPKHVKANVCRMAKEQAPFGVEEGTEPG